jgi:hypothetical protein
MRIKRSNRESLTLSDRWPFRTIKLDSVTMDFAAGGGKFWIDQDAFQIGGGLKLVWAKNNGATAGGILANFGNSGIKARHKKRCR